MLSPSRAARDGGRHGPDREPPRGRALRQLRSAHSTRSSSLEANSPGPVRHGISGVPKNMSPVKRSLSAHAHRRRSVSRRSTRSVSRRSSRSINGHGRRSSRYGSSGRPPLVGVKHRWCTSVERRQRENGGSARQIPPRSGVLVLHGSSRSRSRGAWRRESGIPRGSHRTPSSRENRKPLYDPQYSDLHSGAHHTRLDSAPYGRRGSSLERPPRSSRVNGFGSSSFFSMQKPVRPNASVALADRYHNDAPPSTHADYRKRSRDCGVSSSDGGEREARFPPPNSSARRTRYPDNRSESWRMSSSAIIRGGVCEGKTATAVSRSFPAPGGLSSTCSNPRRYLRRSPPGAAVCSRPNNGGGPEARPAPFPGRFGSYSGGPTQRSFPKRQKSPDVWTHDKFFDVTANTANDPVPKRPIINLYAESFDKLIVSEE